MTSRAAALLAAVLALAACEETLHSAEYEAVVLEDRASDGFAAETDMAGDATPGGEPAAQGGQMLAYAYDATLILPPEAVGDVMAAHRDACAGVGPTVCQVLSASLSADDADRVSAALSFRAAPDYTSAFRAGLAGEADALGGRLTGETQRVEDLTRQVLDLRARLDAQRTLRDRLQGLLAREGSEVADLLAVEKELARVQGEIESMVSQLRYLEGRVSMNTMTMDYRSIPRAFTPSKRQPLLDAVRDFFGILAESLAGLIRFVAAALPWLVIGLPLGWLAVRGVRRSRRRRA